MEYTNYDKKGKLTGKTGTNHYRDTDIDGGLEAIFATKLLTIKTKAMTGDYLLQCKEEGFMWICLI